jgi:protein TIF31
LNGHSEKNDEEVKSKEAAAAAAAAAASTSQENNDESDILEIIQDVGFSVQILSPGVEPLTIQVSSMELVQEIHQLLMDREDTCHRTCFSLQLDGITLDNFAELKNIEGLKEGSIIKVIEEPYTMREARIHVRHVRDLLKSMDPADAYNGVDCSSLTFLHTVTQGN